VGSGTLPPGRPVDDAPKAESEPKDVQTRTRSELGFTLSLVLTLLAAALVPALRAPALTAGFAALEIVGLLVGRWTSLLMAVYGALLIAAVTVDWIGPRLRPGARPLGWLLGILALLGLGYTLVFAGLLNGALLGCALGAGLGGWLLGRRGPETPLEREGPPALALFVFVHLLVEGTAGHLTTRWSHEVSAWLSGLSASSPPAYGVTFGLLAGLLVLLAGVGTTRRAWLSAAGLVAISSAAAVAIAPGGGATLAALFLAAGIGFTTGAMHRRLVDWATLDPLRFATRLAPVGLIALGCVGAHYAGTMWRCPSEFPSTLEQLATDPGAFSLATTPDGAVLVASLRERQELLLIDRGTGEQRRISLASAADTLFDRAEPETLLTLDDGRILVLIAASDGEEGNRLRILDPRMGELSPPLPALGAGVSDIVRDGRGGVWLSTEFEGSLSQIDPNTGEVRRKLVLPDAETNKILVDPDTGQAWSAGLWWDDHLRVIDLTTGGTAAEERIGTHQWDLARSAVLEQVYVPKFLTGRVEVRRSDTLELVTSWKAGFGVRAIEADPVRSHVVTGGLYRGDVSAWRMNSGVRALRHHVGGHVKAVTVNQHGVFAAGNCGIFEVQRPW